MDRHTKTPKFKCQQKLNSDTLCSKEFYSQKDLTGHNQRVHLKEPQNCDICGKTFNCRDYLIQHKKHVHETGSAEVDATFVCQYCGKKLKTNSQLKSHVNFVHEPTVGKLGCKFCERKFNWMTTLKRHMFSKHSYSMDGYQPKKDKDKGKGYQCSVPRCKINFKKEESWRKHMEMKHGGKYGKDGEEEDELVFEFKCKYCGKGFSLRNKFEVHQNAHDKELGKPFQCDLCIRGFIKELHLNKHKYRFHGVEMPKIRKFKNKK